MSNVLCFTVRFLHPQPEFHGRADGGAPEWPPSPLRLFQALVDAAANKWRGQEFDSYAKPALLWFEKLLPPRITTPAHSVGTAFGLSVPNNDLDSPAKCWARGVEPVKPHRPVDLRTMKTVCPVRTHAKNDTDNILYYLFPLPDGASKHPHTLQAAARSITHLGWGIDMVAADMSVITQHEAANLSGERWQTVLSGGTPLRVPFAGTLHALIERHNAFLKRLRPDGFHPVPPLAAFRVARYGREGDPVARPFAAFRLLHPDTGKMQSYPTTDPVKVAGMIRGIAGKLALHSGRAKEWVDQFVYGHHHGSESLPRFSYLPLPSIQPHVGVGQIRRMLIAESPGASGQEVTWMKRLMSGETAPNEQGRDALLVPLTRDQVLNRYVGTSEVWTTVTPVALPGCDDGKPDKRDKLFAKALSHAGYSTAALAELEFRRFPFLTGGEDARKYRPSGDHYLRNCSVYHVRLRWRNPMSGPLAIGSGRHCGLGVFATSSENS